jgi:hypothetical protein
MRRPHPEKVRRSITTEAPQQRRDLPFGRATYLAADQWRTFNTRDAACFPVGSVVIGADEACVSGRQRSAGFRF